MIFFKKGTKEENPELAENPESTEPAENAENSELTEDSENLEPLESAVATVVERMRSELADGGELSPESLEVIRKGVCYEQDLADAAEEAEINGRNYAISQQLEMFDRSDGMPHSPTGSGHVKYEDEDSIFALARAAR